MCCIGHTNVLTNPNPNDITLTTLTKRFEHERAASKRDVLWMKVTLVALIILTPAITVGLTAVAVTFAGAAGLIELALMAATIGGLAIWATWKDLPTYELRLQKGIFEDLLKADNAKLTKEKIELFQKYGAECIQLEVPNFLSGAGLFNGKDIRLGVPAQHFFDAAQRAVGQPKEGDSLNNIVRTVAMQSVIARMRQGNDLLIKAWDTSFDGTGVDQVATKMHDCNLKVRYLSLKKPNEYDANPTEEVVSFVQEQNQKKIRSCQDEVNPIIDWTRAFIGRDTTITWPLEGLAEVLGHCKNLTLLFLNDGFKIQELFSKIDQNPNRGQLVVRGIVRGTGNSMENLNPSNFNKVQDIMDDLVNRRMIVPGKENVRLNDGLQAHQARVAMAMKLFPTG